MTRITRALREGVRHRAMDTIALLKQLVTLSLAPVVLCLSRRTLQGFAHGFVRQRSLLDGPTVSETLNSLAANQSFVVVSLVSLHPPDTLFNATLRWVLKCEAVVCV